MKILVIGDRCSEEVSLKEVLIRRYCESDPTLTCTIGIDFGVKDISIDGQDRKLQIWSASGCERFRAISCAYFRNTKAVLVIFSVIDRVSFESVDGWVEESRIRAKEELPIILVAVDAIGKDRSERVVSSEEARVKASDLGMPFLECSIDTGEGVPELFETVVRLIISQQTRKEIEEAEARAAEREAAGAKKGDTRKCAIQ